MLEHPFYNPPMRAAYREEPCRTALNRVSGMPFRWSLNPYMGCAHRCAFCYVRGFERRADRPWGEAYGASVRVKVNVVDVLRRELGRRSWRREEVAIGAATDPYQPAEGRYRLTRGCIEALAEARTPLSLITRGPLVVRDRDVLAEASRRAEVSVHVSIATLDAALHRWLEPGVAPPAARLRAIRLLTDAGIRAGLALAPVLPGLTDAPAQLGAVIAAAREAGATHMWWNLLNLRPGTRDHFLTVLAAEWPDELARYERLYPASGSGYLAAADSRPLDARLRELRARGGVGDRRRIRLAPEPEPSQLALELASEPPPSGARGGRRAGAVASV
ncbi:MAG TPA: radical SAM protein [Candidatus Limnocylindria bacterium]|nr:radical SAM protein [Candidatus Limnocylindria bacterium]